MTAFSIKSPENLRALLVEAGVPPEQQDLLLGQAARALTRELLDGLNRTDRVILVRRPASAQPQRSSTACASARLIWLLLANLWLASPLFRQLVSGESTVMPVSACRCPTGWATATRGRTP